MEQPENVTLEAKDISLSFVDKIETPKRIFPQFKKVTKIDSTSSISGIGSDDDEDEDDTLVSPSIDDNAADREQWERIKLLTSHVNDLISDAMKTNSLSTESHKKIQESSTELYQITCGFHEFGTRNTVAPLFRPVSKSRKPKIKASKLEGDSKDFTKKKRRKRAVSNPDNLFCHACGARETPEWRRGPDGCKSLCNACGLHYAKIVKREQEAFISQPRNITVNMLID